MSSAFSSMRRRSASVARGGAMVALMRELSCVGDTGCYRTRRGRAIHARGETPALSNLVNVVEDAAGDAHDEHLQIAPGPVPDAARDVHDDALVEFDFG